MDDLGGNTHYSWKHPSAFRWGCSKVKDVHLSSVSWCCAERRFSGLGWNGSPPLGVWSFTVWLVELRTETEGFVCLLGVVFFGPRFYLGGCVFVVRFLGVFYLFVMTVRCEENFWVWIILDSKEMIFMNASDLEKLRLLLTGNEICCALCDDKGIRHMII